MRIQADPNCCVPPSTIDNDHIIEIKGDGSDRIRVTPGRCGSVDVTVTDQCGHTKRYTGLSPKHLNIDLYGHDKIWVDPRIKDRSFIHDHRRLFWPDGKGTERFVDGDIDRIHGGNGNNSPYGGIAAFFERFLRALHLS